MYAFQRLGRTRCVRCLCVCVVCTSDAVGALKVVTAVLHEDAIYPCRFWKTNDMLRRVLQDAENSFRVVGHRGRMCEGKAKSNGLVRGISKRFFFLFYSEIVPGIHMSTFPSFFFFVVVR